MLDTKFRADQHPSLYRNSSYFFFSSKIAQRSTEGEDEGDKEEAWKEKTISLNFAGVKISRGWCISSVPITDHLTGTGRHCTLRVKSCFEPACRKW